jgi:hypothetical protein
MGKEMHWTGKGEIRMGWNVSSAVKRSIESENLTFRKRELTTVNNEEISWRVGL